ncbi:MAG: hypothetical protein JWN70_4950 [Planctomycetaceae bacterium]|nr:hypothetical protein [Planctomycetaceae bacterium]
MGTPARLRGNPRPSSGNPIRDIKREGQECPSYDEESRGLRRGTLADEESLTRSRACVCRLWLFP